MPFFNKTERKLLEFGVEFLLFHRVVHNQSENDSCLSTFSNAVCGGYGHDEKQTG